ncbi:MAG: hypothetical protein EOS25_12625 [Mesorhizobium sp.]|uniref:hypothetical protein n=1 Tax=Mesorhizobium sp. TaxID=1871066 RepID=UPI000FE66340|nr:hypothetical protein [Mesorhizobium sp.]RWD39770.1 MAG: hypothetical protein EOS59_31975 [Mesorhizobium sp.]RWE56602.1 MAG: hypothetical protein EOS24_21000 [Mesorhizobium sp.]RWF08791.1 MAG: hypothetical protein EOS69_21645 [Mesorhizobium sp.]RWF18861.1 MAG: hypothetical protein EOS25_12625 [Mesorhizobium sp.]
MFSTITAAFLASFVEVVEAFTIVLAVGATGSWRPALIGATLALALLAALVMTSVLLEGVEVVFIVIAVGAAHGQTLYASLGALAALVLVMLIALALQRLLARVPENALKFVIGLVLTSFGIFWTGEGIDAHWPGDDLALLAIFGIVALASFAIVRWLRSAYPAAIGGLAR